MGYNYDRFKAQNSEHQWTSYSDLFMALSVVFLLLYVVASVRQGTSSLHQLMAKENVSREVDDLRRQLQVYNALNQSYLDENATQDELQMYEELMDQLHLLQDSARQEKEDLRLQAEENERKEMALNEYQQMVRNMINAQVLARAQIERRDIIIDHKQEQISEMEQEIRNKEEKISQGEREILEIRNRMTDEVNRLEEAYRNQEISKQRMESAISDLQNRSQQQIQELESQNQAIFQDLSQAHSALSQASAQLDTAQSLIEEQRREQSDLQAQLAQAAKSHEEKMAEMAGEFERQQLEARKQFEDALNQERVSGEERARREAEFAAKAREEKRRMQEEMNALQSDRDKALEGLRQAEENARAREELAQNIRDALEKAGVQADVDAGTGDVIIDFGEHYFDTGRADLKPEMKNILKKAVPAYSQSLLSDKQIADRIDGIEIIGFASPTFRGRFVDPNSLNPEDREAVNYNLDLSYQRARSMFNYIFDTNQMEFDFQRKLLPLVKVTGRSYLAEAKGSTRAHSEMSAAEFCELYDCKQAQTVIIRFNLKE